MGRSLLTDPESEWKDLKPQLEHFQRQMRTSRIVREVDTVLPNIGEDSGEVEINPRRASRSFAELGAPIDLGIPAPTIEEYIGQSPSRRSQTMAEFHNAMRERRLRALSEFLDTGAIHEFGSSGIQEPSRTPTSRGGGAMATESRLRHRERPYSDSHPQVPPQSTSPITRRQSRGRRVGGTREDPEIVPSDSE